MEKKLTREELDSIVLDLNSKLSKKRRFASRKIGKLKLSELGDVLYNAYKKEVLDERTWETQWLMIESLGIIRYELALPEIKEILKKNKKEDLVTIGAATAYVRILRRDINDAIPVLDLLKVGNFSVLKGATRALNEDKMHPFTEQINAILNEIETIDEDNLFIKGSGDSGDVRTNIILAAITAKWDKKNPLLKTFLEKCLASENLKKRLPKNKIEVIKKRWDI